MADNGMSLKSRTQKILSTVTSFGDYEKLTQGVFENFPSLRVKDSTLFGTCEAENWFCFSDLMNKQIYAQQNYSLTGYLHYGFVMWHYVFSSLAWQKIMYPSKGYEVSCLSLFLYFLHILLSPTYIQKYLSIYW